ncbi:hypothetical protein H2248_007228 [Termitomyces sp. 'cryptogamus']|nr:hypothetical protein H2248_007228 [Termitomyces sp. 'cryptogamus']
MHILHVDFLTLYLISFVGALQLEVHGERRSRRSQHQRRTPGLSELSNNADISYYAVIEIGRNDYTLLIDTGGSDIWMAGNVPNSNDIEGGVNYVHDSVTGRIKTAEIEFAGYIIPDQAFCEYKPQDIVLETGLKFLMIVQVSPDDIKKAGAGILGLGPNDGSKIYQAIPTVAGAALLDRIFLQNLTTPNYLTVLLGRSGDLTDFYGGSLTVGQVISGFEDILKQPKLPVVNSIAADLHFQVLLDKNGFIGPDGKPIVIRTEVDSTQNEEQATVVLDTGFSLPQVPSSLAAEIYGRFLGAQLVDIDSVGKIWLLPCSQEVSITLKFNNKSYPIHPLDVTLDPTIIGMSAVVDSKGYPLCIGTFQPFTYDTGAKPSYDMVLGMAFLRNVYVLMDYGDFISGSNRKKDAPYVQFLSTTNATEGKCRIVFFL